MHPHNKRDDGFFQEMRKKRPNYIADIRPQGKDIVRTWLHYSMLRIEQLYGIQCFDHAWISGHVVAETGEKMSKSKGNIVRPEPMLKRYGGDALRFFGALEASHGSDVRFSESRLAGTAKFLNKLYNLARFISMLPEPKEGDDIELLESDYWIIEEFQRMWTKATKGYDDLNFHIPARELRAFTWDLFAAHYVELVKNRAYNRDGKFSEAQANGARKTLYSLLNSILKGLAPIAPFITDYIYRELWGESVHVQLFPETPEPTQRYAEIATYLVEFNSLVWKMKKENGKSLRDPIVFATIPHPLEPIIPDLIPMHSIEKYEITNTPSEQPVALIKETPIVLKL